jgi:phosphatidylglycerol:prolipoprotein diacylglycerol transferase
MTLSLLLVLWLPERKRPGDIAGLWLLGAGLAIYLTELWRYTEGRGSVLHGALDVPQVAAIFLVLAGGVVLAERKAPTADWKVQDVFPATESNTQDIQTSGTKDEAAHG